MGGGGSNILHMNIADKYKSDVFFSTQRCKQNQNSVGISIVVTFLNGSNLNSFSFIDR